MVFSPLSALGLLDACGAVGGLFKFSEAPASAGDVEDMGMVQEPVEDGGG